MNTKKKIIGKALNLFSVRGFASVSVRDISSAVGIKASSLYNHFDSKKDIFDSIISMCLERIDKFSKEFNIYTSISKTKLEEFSDSEFFNMHMKLFKFYLEDKLIVKFRKMLTIEKFNNLDIANLYNKIFIDNILNAESKIFSILMNEKIMQKKNPDILALQFYSPFFLLFNKYERVTDNELLLLRNHIGEFKDSYIVKG